MRRILSLKEIKEDIDILGDYWSAESAVEWEVDLKLPIIWVE